MITAGNFRHSRTKETFYFWQSWTRRIWKCCNWTVES